MQKFNKSLKIINILSPCFDEPEFKANLTLTIDHPENTIAISNWPSDDESIVNGRKVTKFETTYSMSTYLFAWFIGPDDYGVIDEKITTKSGRRVKK